MTSTAVARERFAKYCENCKCGLLFCADSDDSFVAAVAAAAAAVERQLSVDSL